MTDGRLPRGDVDLSAAATWTGAIDVDVIGEVSVANTGVIGGDVIITTAAPTYRIESFPAAPALDPVRLAWLLEQPSRLLDARSQVVAFVGRDRDLQDLARWRDAADRALSVRLLHGPGGQGKTRLAAQFAELSANAGWKVVVARHTGDLAIPAGTRADSAVGRHVPESAEGLLVVVDYADRWSHTELLRLFTDPVLHPGVPVRVLLLGRSVQWWPAMRGELAEVRAGTDDQLLGHLADRVPARQDVFDAARDRFAQMLGVGDPEHIRPPGRLSESSYGLVLTLHMAALAAVDADRHGREPPAGPEYLSAYLLDRERMNWRRLYGSRVNGEEFATAPTVMARAVFTAVLAGPTRYATGIAILDKVDLEHPQQVLTDHRVCYPPSDRATVLEPLYPDRLAEDFLALLLPGHDVSGYDPDPWAADAPARLLARDPDGELPSYAPRTITSLATAAGPDRWHHLAEHLNTILRDDPALAIAAGSAALAALAEIPHIDITVLEAIDARLPDHRHIDLDPGIAALTQRLTGYRLARAATDDERARLHTTLGWRLSNAGRREDALAAVEAAVEIRRRLAANPDAHDLGPHARDLGLALVSANHVTPEPGLAEALINLGAMLTALGRWPDALAATEEAAEIFRRLAAVNPAAYQHGLATSLGNLGSWLSRLGRADEAQGAASEAVEIYRRLAAANPAVFEADLAMSMTNMGDRLSRLGRTEEAQGAASEAVEVYRRLAAANPAAFEPGLAMSLNNLGSWLSKLGQLEEALAATQASASIRRRLAAVNPGAHEPGLASTLDNLGQTLAKLGREQEAVAATEEAVKIYRRLAAANPQAHDSDLARVLSQQIGRAHV